MSKRQDLIDAVELISKYIDENLPKGVVLRMEFRAREDTFGVLVGVDAGFFLFDDRYSVVEACDFAKDVMKEKEKS